MTIPDWSAPHPLKSADKGRPPLPVKRLIKAALSSVGRMRPPTCTDHSKRMSPTGSMHIGELNDYAQARKDAGTDGISEHDTDLSHPCSDCL